MPLSKGNYSLPEAVELIAQALPDEDPWENLDTVLRQGLKAWIREERTGSLHAIPEEYWWNPEELKSLADDILKRRPSATSTPAEEEPRRYRLFVYGDSGLGRLKISKPDSIYGHIEIDVHGHIEIDRVGLDGLLSEQSTEKKKRNSEQIPVGRKFSEAKARKKYKDRVKDYYDCPPSREDDEHWGRERGYSRPFVRELRNEHAPSHWHKTGPRKSGGK
jgi:hypothetical protein